MTKLVEVTWHDAWYDAEEHSELNSRDHAKPAEVVSVGYLIVDDEAGVMLARNYHPTHDTYQHRYFIPIGMVVHMRTILE